MLAETRKKEVDEEFCASIYRTLDSLVNFRTHFWEMAVISNAPRSGSLIKTPG